MAQDTLAPPPPSASRHVQSSASLMLGVAALHEAMNAEIGPYHIGTAYAVAETLERAGYAIIKVDS